MRKADAEGCLQGIPYFGIKIKLATGATVFKPGSCTVVSFCAYTGIIVKSIEPDALKKYDIAKAKVGVQ